MTGAAETPGRLDHADGERHTDGEHRATVVTRTELVLGIVELTLRPDRTVGAVPPGSHIDLAVPLEGGPETRSYSLVDLGDSDSDRTRVGRYRIAVRRDDAGRGGSRWLHTLQPGRSVTCTGPASAFAPSPGGLPSVLLAAGIGITPIIGLARAVRDAGSDYRIVYAGHSRDRMAYLDHLERDHPDRVRIVESAHGTRVESRQLVAAVPADGVLYVCGPMSLLTAIRAEWQQTGRPAGNLRFETFGTSGTRPASAFRAHVPSHGLSVDVPTGTTLLDALENAGVEMMYGCRRGECGLCRVRVLASDGDIDHRDVFLSERQRLLGRQMCACVSRVAGASITIDC
ncbi:PDR/VanB family oxidoreductase [Streptomyces griseiscabiei]|uniref:PDR/VanB family oxidoreductase n=2 Tax=Streptomyces griseiscabiei TaxID=2993540 RepID=A0ABU4LFL6_9ACTN|nr:PDR/VanB family oxidoreductase [Streptomyces griseiscabiei]MBZ3900396.1 oxidoreductase [Streptomyces griseiscabiei]MDX2914564.1 PDR/VanB family oxidoreductase [Streptomyces griseiscabiei]